MRDQLVRLLEGAGIEQQVHSFTRRQLAGVVLLLEAIFTATKLRAPFEILEIFDRVHSVSVRTLSVSLPAPSASVPRTLGVSPPSCYFS